MQDGFPYHCVGYDGFVVEVVAENTCVILMARLLVEQQFFRGYEECLICKVDRELRANHAARR